MIDDRGRLFGTVNLIDALVGVVLLGLIPLTYGAFRLFRVPDPRITSISPSEVTARQPATLQITGEDLRPFLYARIGSQEVAFLIESPTRAEVRVPELAAGTYDIALYDEAQELFQLPGALTVRPAPPPAQPTAEVQAVGAFVGIGKDQVPVIEVGSRLAHSGLPEPIAEVVTLHSPEPDVRRINAGTTPFGTGVSVMTSVPGELRIPAILRVSCALVNGECRVGDTVVALGATLTLSWSRWQLGHGAAAPTSERVRFLIDEVRPSGARLAVATVRVRFTVQEELIDLINVGDVDVGGSSAAVGPSRAVLTDIGSERQTMTAQTTTSVLDRSYMFQGPVVAFTATLRVPVVFTPSGWTYKGRPVKVGAPFAFETVSGAMGGWVLDMKPNERANLTR